MEWHMGQSPSINPDHRVFRMMAEARRQHGNVQLSLKSLSVRLRTCDRHLGRLFKKCTGVAFRQYLRSVRMVTAKTRLLRTSQSVQQVALTLGYEVSAMTSNAVSAPVRLGFEANNPMVIERMSGFYTKLVRF